MRISKASVSVGALIHGAGLVAAHFVAKQCDKPLAKLGTYAAFIAGVGFVCKLLHQRVARDENELLGRLEDAEQMAYDFVSLPYGARARRVPADRLA